MSDDAWEMFLQISSLYYGKQAYFLEGNGTVYSRFFGEYLPNTEDLENTTS